MLTSSLTSSPRQLPCQVPRGAGGGRFDRLPGWAGAALVGGTFVALLWLESRRPLRAGTESKVRRAARNLAVAATSAAALQVADAPVTGPLSRWVERRRWGLVKWLAARLRLPRWVEVLAGLALLDYTLYLWHVAFHKVPWLWRFHQVHHADLDLDASTGVRFHFGEMLLSVLLRVGQILAVGVSPLTLSVWDAWVLCEVMFHHSNVELPPRVERWLGRFVVTPRMHGIHHSVIPGETNSNWSSGLAVWDWLHGTLRQDVPQDRIVIGVPDCREPSEVTFPKLMKMPFASRREPRQSPTPPPPA